MDEIKIITEKEFLDIVSRHPFSLAILTKDYYITALLYLIKDVKEIHFKGGTALQKTFLDNSRLSEDIDFSVTSDIPKVKEEITKKIKESGIFEDITENKQVEKFVRIVVHYKGFSGEKGNILIDLNERDILLRKPEKHEIKHFYKPFIPEFSISILAKEEMIAEKVRAAITRNKPRDHFDIYKIIKAKIPIDLDLVEKKCKQTGNEFNVIKMFSKANKLKNLWDEDIIPLLAEEVSFQEVMRTLSRYFKLKDEKEKQKLAS